MVSKEGGGVRLRVGNERKRERKLQVLPQAARSTPQHGTMLEGK